MNDAPDLLSIYFSGRDEELERLDKTFAVPEGNAATRCAVYGMPGSGKTQLALKYAQSAYERGCRSIIFWISATTVEKLNEGFARILDLVQHPDRYLPEQSAKLTAVQRFLERNDDQGSGDWLLVLDNATKESINFLRQHLPRNSLRGNILVTTRTEDLAKAVISTAGRQHIYFELRAPSVQDAARILLRNDVRSAQPSDVIKAEELVKCIGCLPLAIDQAASFMEQSRNSLDDLLGLYKSEQKHDVGWLYTYSP